MNREMMNLRQAASHIHMEVNELKHAAQRGELEAFEHGGDWWFDHRALDEWAQRYLLSANRKEQDRQHRVIVEENRRSNRDDWRLSSLFVPDSVELEISGKAKAGIVRDMADLAGRSGFVYDTDGLFKELMSREEVASTAVGEGAAFLHPRFHDPYLFERTFIAYGRSIRPVFFGAQNGDGTRHFFLICAADHEEHLHILSRLAVMTHATDFLRGLDEVDDVESAIATIAAAEEELLR